MAFFTDMKRSLTETGKQVAQKTKELSDTVQLKAQLSREKEALNRQYAQIGKKVFEAANEADEEAYTAEFTLIRESLKTIDELQDKLSTLEGFIHCPNAVQRLKRPLLSAANAAQRSRRQSRRMTISMLSIQPKRPKPPEKKRRMRPAPARQYRMRSLRPKLLRQL